MFSLFSIYNSLVLLFLPFLQTINFFFLNRCITSSDFFWFIPELFLIFSLLTIFFKNILQKNFFFFLNQFYYELKLVLITLFFILIIYYYSNWSYHSVWYSTTPIDFSIKNEFWAILFNSQTETSGPALYDSVTPPFLNGSTAFFNHLLVNNLSIVLKIFLLILFIPLFLVLDSYLKKSGLWSLEFLFLIVLNLFFLLISLSANNLFTMFLSLEGAVLVLLVLSAAQNSSIFSLEASLKGLIGGALSFSLVLLGLFFILLATGSLYCNDILFLSIFADKTHLNLLVVGSSFLVLGFLFKFCTFPFHFFFLDVYDGVPLAVSAQFLVPVKFVYFVLFINIFLNYLVVPFAIISKIFIPFILFSLVYGPLVTMDQRKLKRFLSYSSMNNGNLLLLALLSISGVTQVFILSNIYYAVFIYFFTFNLVFIFLFTNKVEMSFLNADYFTLNSFSGLGKVNLYLCLALVIPFLSIMGLPPLAGFFGKYTLLNIIISTRSYVVTCVFLLSNLLSFAYYLAFIKLIISGNPKYLRFVFNYLFFNSFYFLSYLFSILLISFFIFFSSFIFSFLNNALLLFWNTDNYFFFFDNKPLVNSFGYFAKVGDFAFFIDIVHIVENVNVFAQFSYFTFISWFGPLN